MDKIVHKYFQLTSLQKDRISLMFHVYSEWNEKVNLISRKDFPYFYERHVLHSLSIAKFFSFNKSTHIMDLGSGGGFPGVPLAIQFPQVHFFLVDSIRKKTDTLKSIIKQLSLPNVTVINQRAEDISNTFDFVICRAVARLSMLDSWTKGLISSKNKHSFENGLICLKGGDLSDEIKGLENRVQIFNISDSFQEDFFSEKKILYLKS
ncbi:16S rRNA (guanine(527)-N(7))-methyltransferase RsmG [Flavobacteriales bacterium]|nr:16S rRNA (guanine(527)-N(7))-methyltransferase RsmG [Flavobacteriales bacterium]